MNDLYTSINMKPDYNDDEHFSENIWKTGCCNKV